MILTPQQIEQDVRRTIGEKYQNATLPDEMSVVSLQLDAAVEKLAEARLGPYRSAELRTFDDKVKAAGFRHSAALYQLHKRRSNQVGHHTDIDPHEAIALAHQYVNTILSIWPDLFGPGNPPPRVTPPRIAASSRQYTQTHHQVASTSSKSPADTPAQYASSKQDRKQQRTTQRKIDWHLLLVALGLWVLTSWLIGLALGSLNGRSALVTLIAGVAAFAVALASLGMVVRFARGAGIRLVLAVLLALVAGWFLLRILVLDGPNPAFAHGYNFALSIITPVNSGSPAFFDGPAISEPQSPTQPRPTRTSAGIAPVRETPPAGGQLIEQQAPTEATEPLSLAGTGPVVGNRVRVVTAGNRLNGRSDPGLSGAIQVAFENGEELEVIDGPVMADGYSWWLVRGPTGEGWSADEFLESLP